MSRFDLFFILVDDCNEARVYSVCAVFLHQSALVRRLLSSFIFLASSDPTR